MSAVLAISRRELLAFLLSPVGALIVALFLFFTALVFFVAAPLLVGAGFAPGQPASLRLFFQVALWVFFVVGPAISMRAISEELRLGTLEMLLTAPVTERQIVLGKFLGSLAFVAVMLAPTALFVVALEAHGRPDYGELLCGYLGLLLVGAAFLASGILASSLTSSQVLAYVSTLFFWLILMLATRALPFLVTLLREPALREDAAPALRWLLAWLEPAAVVLAAGDPVARARDFVDGLVDSFSVVYFVAFTAVLLAAAVRTLGLRRWP